MVSIQPKVEAGLIGVDMEGYFPDGLLEKAIPLLVLRCLVQEEQGDLVVVSRTNELAFAIDYLDDAITVSEIAEGKFLETWDFDEKPTPVELALEFYDDIRTLLAKKRIANGITR